MTAAIPLPTDAELDTLLARATEPPAIRAARLPAPTLAVRTLSRRIWSVR